MRTKICIQCRCRKLLKEFYLHKTHIDGYRSECKVCCCANGRGRYHKNKTRFKLSNRRSYLKAKYRITLEQYERMFKQQKGTCAVCGSRRLKSKKKFAVDHDHKTKRIRGLLCASCNLKLGWYEKHKKAIDKYL